MKIILCAILWLASVLPSLAGEEFSGRIVSVGTNRMVIASLRGTNQTVLVFDRQTIFMDGPQRTTLDNTNFAPGAIVKGHAYRSPLDGMVPAWIGVRQPYPQLVIMRRHPSAEKQNQIIK